MGATSSNSQGSWEPLIAETPGSAAIRKGQKAGALLTHSSYALLEEEIKEWENGFYCSMALLASPILAHGIYYLWLLLLHYT